MWVVLEKFGSFPIIQIIVKVTIFPKEDNEVEYILTQSLAQWSECSSFQHQTVGGATEFCAGSAIPYSFSDVAEFPD